MKHLLAVVLIAFYLNGFTQQKPLEWHTDVNKAINISVESGKPLFLFFTGSDWCGWCIRLQKEVFVKPEFAIWANKNVVLLELDFNRAFQERIKLSQNGKVKLTENESQIIELSRSLQVRGYPTIWFVSAMVKDGKEISLTQLGYQPYMRGGPSVWIPAANKIINSNSTGE